MSNRGRDDDFDFDEDPFADDNDDPFGDDPFADDDADDLRATARGSTGRGDDDFGGFDDDLGFEDDDLGGLDSGDEDFEFDEGDEEEGGGRNRRFVILAAIIIILFVVALGAIVLVSLMNQQNSPFAQTSTAIANINNTQIAFGNQTSTQSILFQNATQTAAALPTNTPTPTPISDADLTATGVVEQQTLQANLDTDGDGIPDVQDDDDDGDGIPDAVDLNPLIFDDADGDGIGDGFATQTAEFVPTDDSPIAILTQAEQTRLALTPSATTGGVLPGGTLSITDVFATATALAQTLAATPGGQVTTTPGVFPTRPPSTGQLPDTGLFDGMSGEQGLGMMALMAVGLVGVIFVSRRLRK